MAAYVVHSGLCHAQWLAQWHMWCTAAYVMHSGLLSGLCDAQRLMWCTAAYVMHSGLCERCRFPSWCSSPEQLLSLKLEVWFQLPA